MGLEICPPLRIKLFVLKQNLQMLKILEGHFGDIKQANRVIRAHAFWGKGLESTHERQQFVQSIVGDTRGITPKFLVKSIGVVFNNPQYSAHFFADQVKLDRGFTFSPQIDNLWH